MVLNKRRAFLSHKVPFVKETRCYSKVFHFYISTALSAGKAAETKTNDILAMISPEGERVGLSKVSKMFAL